MVKFYGKILKGNGNGKIVKLTVFIQKAIGILPLLHVPCFLMA